MRAAARGHRRNAGMVNRREQLDTVEQSVYAASAGVEIVLLAAPRAGRRPVDEEERTLLSEMRKGRVGLGWQAMGPRRRAVEVEGSRWVPGEVKNNQNVRQTGSDIGLGTGNADPTRCHLPRWSLEKHTPITASVALRGFHTGCCIRR